MLGSSSAVCTVSTIFPICTTGRAPARNVHPLVFSTQGCRHNCKCVRQIIQRLMERPLFIPVPVGVQAACASGHAGYPTQLGAAEPLEAARLLLRETIDGPEERKLLATGPHSVCKSESVHGCRLGLQRQTLSHQQNQIDSLTMASPALGQIRDCTS
jgi:hypothetical protein